MKKLFFSAITLVALCIGAAAQTTAKVTPAKTSSTTRTTTKSTPAGTTSVEKTTTTSAKTPASKPRHKRHFIQKKKTATANK